MVNFDRIPQVLEKFLKKMIYTLVTSNTTSKLHEKDEREREREMQRKGGLSPQRSKNWFVIRLLINYTERLKTTKKYC